MARLLITQCSDPHMWYADRVGQTVRFIRSDSDGYWSRDDGGYINIVRFEDARIVDLDQLEQIIDDIKTLNVKDLVKTTYDSGVAEGFRQALIKYVEDKYGRID